MHLRLTALCLAVAAAAVAAQDEPHWSHRTRRVALDNGLTVLMLERGELPIVSVQALYRFGSRNERPGQTGAAHFVEHMAFRSTDEIAKQDLTNQILRWGGRWNGYTSYDQTVYGSHAPSEYLEWLLYLERQRMRHVRFDPSEVERERTSVIAEERQYRNSPVYTLVEHRLRRAALVAHPYGSPIMGRMSDLEGITPRELDELYRDHYAPNNLILAIVGRFDPAQALGLVRKHFGDAPRDGASTAIRTIEPPQQGARRVVMRTGSGRSHIELVVHAPAASSTEFATLLALDGVLAGGKAPGRAEARPGSRLHRGLIESGLAAAVTTEVELSEYAALYSIGVSAGRDADLPAIEGRLHAVLQDAMQNIKEDEVARAVRQITAHLAFAAASNRSVANLLTVYEQLGSFTLLSSIPQRLRAVNAEAVRAFARERLAPDRRSLGLLLPDPSPSTGAASEDRSAAARSAAGADAAAAPQRRSTRPLPPPKLKIPDLPESAIRRLQNGLTVLAARVPGESTHMRVRIAAGSRFDPTGREGTALLAARIVGGGGASPLRALEDREINLSVSALDDEDPFEFRNVVEIGAMSLPEDLLAVAKAVVPAIATPIFEAGELDRMRVSLADELSSNQNDSRWRANHEVFDRMYEPSDPYGRPVEGTPESRGAITAADLSAFHRAYYRPERTIVAIAGPLDPRAAIERVGEVLGTWRADSRSVEHPARAAALPPQTRSRDETPPNPPGDRVVHIPLEKEQASIAVGLPGVARNGEDFTALAALNYLLGETGYAGRLGERLVDTGLAYAVYSSLFADRAAGPVFITTDALHARQAVDRIVVTLDEFARDGVTDAELREAKGFLLGRLLFRFESVAPATAALADLGYFGDDSSPESFARRVLGLTQAQVSAAARRYYDSSSAIIVVAGRW